MNIPVVTVLCLYHCYCNGAATFGSQPYPSQPDFRQHALDIGNRLSDLLKQEIAFLSKISNTPITDLDRMTIPSIISTWPATTVTNQPPSTNQITINTYAGPATQPGTSVSSGQCQSTPIQCPTMQITPSSNPPNGYAGVGPVLQGIGAANQEGIRPPGGDGVSMGGGFASPNPPPPETPLPLPYQGGTTEVIQTDQGPVTIQIPPSPSQPVDYLPQQSQPQGGSFYNPAPPLQPLPPLSSPSENNPSLNIGDYINTPSPTDSQPQLGQTNPLTNFQPPYNPLPSFQQPGQNINPPVAAIPITQPQPIIYPSPATIPSVQQPQQNINLPVAANPFTQPPQPNISPSAAASPTVQQPQQNINPPVAAMPITQPQPIINPSPATSPSVQQPQQNINLPVAANPFTQTPQPNISPSAAASPTAQQPQQNINPPVAASPTVQQPLLASNPLVGTSPLTTGQTLSPVNVNLGNPTLGYPQVQNNAATPTNQQTPIVSGTQGWPQGQPIFQPAAPLPVTQTPQTPQVLPAQTQSTGTVAPPLPGVPPFQAFPAPTIPAAVPAVNA